MNDRTEREILFTVKPNKASFVWIGVLFGAFTLLLGLLLSFFMQSAIAYLLCLGVATVVAFCIQLAYNKREYCLENGKIILRTGVFKQHRRIIACRDITKIEIRIAVLDKISGKKTGSIYFLTKEREECLKKRIRFGHIENVERVYREIKREIK